MPTENSDEPIHVKAAQPTSIVELSPETPPGASVDAAAPSLYFHTPYITKGSRFEVGRLDGIAHGACFVSAAGEVTPAYGQEPSTAGQPTQGHSFVLRPQRPLQPNRWYRLVLELGPALRMQDSFASAFVGGSAGALPADPEPGAAPVWSQHFFTGSSPRIVWLRWTESKTAPSLQVVFSEPLLVTEQLCHELLVSGRAAQDHGCEALLGQRQGSLAFSLEPGEPFGHLPLLELRLPAEAQGLARSVSEGASRQGKRPSAGKRDFRLSLGRSEFTNCSVNEHCWSEPPPKLLGAVARLGCR